MAKLIVNDKSYLVDAEPDTPLLWVLRENLQLTGTKFGCGRGICGACSIHINGEAIRSCQIRVEDAVGKTITTIEGLGEKKLHPVQEAWRLGGFDILMCLWLIIVMVLAIRFILKNFEKSKFRTYGIAAIIVAGIVIIRITAEPGIEAIEGVNPAKTGFLGGFGLPIIFSWIVGALSLIHI